MSAIIPFVPMDAEARLKKQFQAISGQDFVKLMLDAKERLERTERERLQINAYGRNHDKPDAA